MFNAINQITDETTRRFAEATYDDYYGNIEQIPTDEDETDMKTWGITAEQWHEAVNAARADLRDDEQ